MGRTTLAMLAGTTAALGLVSVIVAGFALSLDALSAVAQAAHIRAGLSWLLPSAIDGAMTVGTVAIVVMRRLGHSTMYPWCVVGVNAAISVVGNALHAYSGSSLELPGPVAMTVSAVPALNLALSVHLLVVLVDALATVLARTSQLDHEPVRSEPDAADQTPETERTGPRRATRTGLPGQARAVPNSGTDLEAVAAYRASVAAGEPFSERGLGNRYGRSRRWARHIKELAAESAVE